MKPFTIFMMLVLLGTQLLAQASLEINVLDKDGQPVTGQVITVSNPAIGFIRTTQANEKGKVQLDGLSTSGAYNVEAMAGSFYEAQSIQGISLISDRVTSVNLVLQDNVTALDAVTVTAREFRTINTINAEVASELNAREIAQLPVEGRDITRVLYRLPNITQATGFFPEAPNVAINGANSLYTNYQIDGLDNNENFLGGQRFAMPVGFTKNITALTNNFSAEHGLTSNGIINITTQSGTNEVKGEAFFITRPGPVIDAPSAYAQRDLSGNQVKDGFQRYQSGFAVGGPIRKDKTFYFLNVEHTTDLKDNLLNVPQMGINETVRGTNRFSYLSAKIDQNWNKAFRSSLRINTGLVNIERQGGGLEGGSTFPSAGNQQDRNSLNIALKNTWVGEGKTWEGNYLFGRFRWNYANPVDDDSPSVSILDPSGQNMASIGHPGYVFDELEHTHVWQQKLTLYKKDHRIKLGGQLKSSGYQLFGGGNPNGSWLVQLSQAQLDALNNSGIGSDLSPTDLPTDVQVLNYNIELRPNAFTHRQNIISLYAEDQWTVSSRLNVNVGLRYDYDNLSKGGSDQGDLNNLAPRLSANYRLSDRAALRVGYGVYYDKVLYAIYSDALQFNSTSADYKKQIQALVDLGLLPKETDVDAVTNEGNLGANDNSAAYLQGIDPAQLQGQRESVFQNELRILNPNGYDNPYSHQFTVGYQRKVSEKASFYVDVMHNRSYNLFRLRNLNAPAPYPVVNVNTAPRSTTDADLSRPIPIFNDAGSYAVINGETLTGIARNVVMTESAGRSNYYAMNVTLQKDQADDRYAYRLMYTLSYLENNTEDINFRAMDGNDFEAEWGPSINDRRHLINGIFSYFPTDGLTLTLAGLLQSGQPINRIPDATIFGTTDLNGDGRAFGDAYVGNSDRHPGESRNSDRLPWATTFDLSTWYQLPIATNRLEIGAQVFNLLNAKNLSGYANNATQSNQIQTGSAGSGIVNRNVAPPRQFQFSLRFLF
ncbi:MAG: TonB-dependent receptor [Saprospiraceae bacterium]